MCIGPMKVKAPPPPPLPPPPPAPPQEVGTGVKKVRSQDKQKAAFLAGKNRTDKKGSAGLLTPTATAGDQTNTLIGA